MRCVFGIFVLRLCIPLASAQGIPPPFYAASSIVNAADHRSEALAPNTIATIYGKDLAFITKGLSPEDLRGGILPTTLIGTGVRLLVGRMQANLYFVSPTQVNFLVPSLLTAGPVEVQLSLDGRYGPAVKVGLSNVSPALFHLDPQFALATRPDGSVITRDTPAQPGEIIILYATGLGQTLPRVPSGQIPTSAARLDRLRDFRVTLDGRLIEGGILYAGVAPGFAGLYQINLLLPEWMGRNPEIRIGFEESLSPRELTLPAGQGGL